MRHNAIVTNANETKFEQDKMQMTHHANLTKCKFKKMQTRQNETEQSANKIYKYCT